MEWMTLAGLGIIWIAVLLPTGHRKNASSVRSVEDFERNMQLLADTEGEGRWIVAPRKGARFLGPEARAQARTRDRRRRVLVFLLEMIGLTGLIGAAPPLRVVWYATGGLAVLLAVYVFVLISIKQRSPQAHARQVAQAAAPAAPRTPAHAPGGQRFVAGGNGRAPRPVFNGLGSFGEGDRIRVVVRPREAEAAGV